MQTKRLNRQNIIACIWDFDKTLIPGYMQTPIFDAFGIDEKQFWKEVNELPTLYKSRGQRVSKDTIYLNHLLSYVRNGPLKGLNNAKLRELGAELKFYPGLPDFFKELQQLVRSDAEFVRHDITLEHYVISTGLAEMVRGCAIADYVEEIYGCEFLENPAPPHYSMQAEMVLDGAREISQVGTMVDNTIKTRYIFEINKGTNKFPDIDVNANIALEDRRIPLQNMIYTADGPSDVPVFSIVKKNGGRAYAVYDPSNPAEFTQNDNLLQIGRVHAYGPADYRSTSSTSMWLKMHVLAICERIVKDQEEALKSRVAKPPQHLHKEDPVAEAADDGLPEQTELM